MTEPAACGRLQTRATLRSRIVAAVAAVSQHLLFGSFLLSLAAVILTDYQPLPLRLQHWLVMPSFGVALLLSPWRGENGARHPLVAMSRSTTLWACTAYIAVLCLSTALQADAAGTSRRLLQHFAKLGGDVVVFLSVAAYLFVAYPRFLQRFMIGISALLAVNAVINVAAYVQAWMIAPLIDYRLSASFGTPLYVNATHLAPLYAIWSVAAVSLLANGALHRIGQVIVAVSAAILLPAVLLTQARGGILAVVIGLLIIAMLAKPRWRWTIVGSICIAAVVALSVELVRIALIGRGDSFRLALAFQYLQIAMDRPWTGFGLVREIAVPINGILYEQPHNTLVWAQLRGGIIATLAAMTMLVGALFWSLRYWMRKRVVAPFVAMLLLSITALTEIGFLVVPYNWLWVVFWLPIGIAAGAEQAMKGPMSLPSMLERKA